MKCFKMLHRLDKNDRLRKKMYSFNTGKKDLRKLTTVCTARDGRQDQCTSNCRAKFVLEPHERNNFIPYPHDR